MLNVATATKLDPLATKTLRVGHTPDPDDAFMFYGFATDQVKIRDFKIDHILEDIQSLNKKALRSEIEVTAISAALYPHLNNNYWILPMGASVGRNYGPIVVRRRGNLQPEKRRIGIPGKNTTAFLLLRLYTSGFQPVEMTFDEIPQAVLDGKLDYGLLIHEAQLTYASMGLEKIMDLGVEWMNDTHLPIPLGLDVIRKDLGREFALEIAEGLKKSIQIAHEQKDQAVAYALKFGRGVHRELGEKFVDMYVNEDTMDMGDEGEKALNLLFDKAYRAGYYPSPTKVDVLRPI